MCPEYPDERRFITMPAAGRAPSRFTRAQGLSNHARRQQQQSSDSPEQRPPQQQRGRRVTKVVCGKPAERRVGLGRGRRSDDRRVGQDLPAEAREIVERSRRIAIAEEEEKRAGASLESDSRNPNHGAGLHEREGSVVALIYLEGEFGAP